MSLDPLFPKMCEVVDLNGDRHAVPHDYSHHCCKRCGAIEPEVKKVLRGRFSGKSARPHGGYELY